MTRTWFSNFKTEFEGHFIVEKDGQIQAEIDSLAQVHRLLTALPPKSRTRVLAHLLEAYEAERPST